MANPPNPVPSPASAQGQIELVARRLSVVTVRGISYEFSIQGSISDKRCDELVINHIQYLLAASGRDSFDSITSTFKKNDDQAAHLYTLEKSNVTYVTGSGKAKNKNAKTEYIANPKPGTKEKVEQYWTATQSTFEKLTTGAADPLQLTPQPANQNPAQLPAPAAQANQNPAPAANPAQQRPASPKPTVITPYKNRAKRMDKNPSSTVELALADQLSKMPNPKYKGKTPASLVPQLRQEYLDHIKDHKDEYAKDGTKFKGIFDSLVTANKNDKTKLHKMCENLHSTKWGARAAGYTNINTSQLENALLKNPSDLTAEEKEDLIKIHNAYIESGGVLDAGSFLKAFVNIHNQENPDMFEVVVVDDTNAPKSFLLSSNASGLPTIEHNCAFLYVDAQGRHQSIPREKVDFRLGDSLVPPSVADTDANNAAVLENLIDLYDTYTEASIHNYVLGNPPFQTANSHFRLKHTHAFERLKNFIYKRDKKDAQSDAARQAIEDNLDYGGYRLQQLSPDELASLLKANRDNILNIADNEDFQIV